jgi:shikimate kinase
MLPAAPPISEPNLIITGSIGPGQLALMRSLGTQLRLPFVSVEQLIAQRVDLPVDEVRAYYGETRLKSIESEIIDEAILRRSSLIYVGGRTLLNGEHLARLQSVGVLVCLVIKLGAMLRRLHINMGARYANPNERALELGTLKREWDVRNLTDLYQLDVTYMSDDEIIAVLSNLWSQVSIVRG